MTKRKPKPMQIRDERGRFAHASPEVRAGLEAMRPKHDEVKWIPIPNVVYGEHRATGPVKAVRIFTDGKQIYCDEIYRPKKIGWLERIIRFWMWRHA